MGTPHIHGFSYLKHGYEQEVINCFALKLKVTASLLETCRCCRCCCCVGPPAVGTTALMLLFTNRIGGTFPSACTRNVRARMFSSMALCNGKCRPSTRTQPRSAVWLVWSAALGFPACPARPQPYPTDTPRSRRGPEPSRRSDSARARSHGGQTPARPPGQRSAGHHR